MAAKRIDPERARELLHTGDYVFLDVRTPDEFYDGHVPQARNIPFMVRGPGGAGIFFNVRFVQAVEARFDRDARLIVGCQKGGRSVQAADLLVEKGYSHVFDMRGGFIGETDPFGNITFPGWCARGYPSTTDCEPEEKYTPPP